MSFEPELECSYRLLPGDEVEAAKQTPAARAARWAVQYWERPGLHRRSTSAPRYRT